MARIIIADPMPVAERRRAKALELSIQIAPGRYPMLKDYLAEAEQIEAWLREASDDPGPRGERDYFEEEPF